jgi:hypothetical protein
VSQAGFDGDLDSRILSSGEVSLRGHVTTEARGSPQVVAAQAGYIRTHGLAAQDVGVGF